MHEHADIDEQWLSRRYYGGDLSEEAERQLHLAAATYADGAAALAALERAAEIAPGHPAVDLGFYKFHFYKHRLGDALGYADKMILHGLKRLGLHNRDWRTLDPEDAEFTGLEADPRFLLFALVARGYLLLRLGRYDEGRDCLAKVAALDPDDRLGAARLIAVADGRLFDDESGGAAA